ncbi:TetR/AcrR family transcriptional regulator [Streptacidiphilus rugosus]|uniref:TetR/AcrR family transcriptional regulator n=1 Tax=Streptacidiphilus rugosus TaxID=405783 RepID=UPI00055BA6F4|nr:TetR/AcrR family transcriptional regulator [Streptacidiphilus rugosus]
MAEQTGTPRQRYRAQVREEIKARAWDQIAEAGASALSLNAVAKQLGMTGPALYRYFGGRDELITELVTDAYRSLADAFRAAAEAGPDPVALARRLRAWAAADPHRYFLVYGTPVPGYQAPPETTAIAVEIMGHLLDACTAHLAARQGDTPPDASPEAPSEPLAAHLAEQRRWAGEHPAPPAALALALRFWTRLHGVLSLELAGHFTGMGLDPERLFEAETAALGVSAGRSAAAPGGSAADGASG